MRALLLCLIAITACSSRHHSGSPSDLALPVSDMSGEIVPQDLFAVMDPQTCEEAGATSSYVGCDYWPTPVSNIVNSLFDFAVVVANTGAQAADVTVTGANGFSQNAQVQPDSLTKIYLPWVADLRANASAAENAPSIKAVGGAYHLVSSRPVIVYQFNPLEYRAAGGPSGKDWTTCPGYNTNFCYSFTNDASLLLPTTAMSGNYRIAGMRGPSFYAAAIGSYFAVTATADNTNVRMKVSATGSVSAGGGLAAASSGEIISFDLQAGDVMEVVGGQASTSDLSGSLLLADHPVQIIAGNYCIMNPLGVGSCDHIEETVFPVETLGKRYIVPMVTGPKGDTPGQTVRFVGNVDGTQLVFDPAVANAPTTLNAGQVVELTRVMTNFQVTGNHEFAVSTVQLAGSIVDPLPPSPNPSEGDPALSSVAAVEQYRLKYVFLAPDDYDVSYADITAPTSATLMLDGAPVTQSAMPIGSSGFGVIRVKLDSNTEGAHLLTSDQPVGLQVSGYGGNTSYQFPGGLNLYRIAPTPIF